MMILGSRFQASNINDSVSENLLPFQCIASSSNLEGNISGEDYVIGFGRSIQTLPEWLRAQPSNKFWLFFPL